jgi:hypothetical protein
MSIITKSAEWFSKLHFLATLAMFFFIAMMVVEDEMAVRALLLIPVVLVFVLQKIMYSIDQQVSTEKIVKEYRRRSR